ncbi:MAG TPA: hypothetical protein ENN03_11595 [bacterium]|nr:hypothetical protein [bacterium]
MKNGWITGPARIKHGMWILYLAAWAGLFVLSQTVHGQTAETVPHVSRADFAASYLRFEQAFLTASLDSAETVRVNREFDALTLLFFSRSYDRAVRKLHELTSSLSSGGAIPAAAASLAVRVEPSIYVFGQDKNPAPFLRIESLYALPESFVSIDLAAEIRPPDGSPSQKPVLCVPFTAEWEEGRFINIELPFPIDPSTIEPGMHDLGIRLNTEFIRTGSWTIVRNDLDDVRERNDRRIESLRIGTEHELRDALESVSARNRLLASHPSPENTAQAVLDLALLAEAVENEIEALRRKENPFRERKGDSWRVIPFEEHRVPVRVYAPGTGRPDAGWPLLIAFHGAGGDENMFMEGYGAGLIRTLADSGGVVIASPFANAFAGVNGTALFDRLLEMLSKDYCLDMVRVYLIGHSMGAGVVNRLVQARSQKIAAAACLCGFRGFGETVESVPPVLVIAAELDPLAGPARIRPAVEEAAARDLPVTYRMVPGYGHTLVVSHKLPDVFTWLTGHEKR